MVSSPSKQSHRLSRWLALAAVLLLAIAPLSSALAQDTYLFSVPRERVDVYWEADGTLTLDYEIVFQNAQFAHPIDVVDLGLPNSNYRLSNISASLDGQPPYSTDYQSDYIDIGPAFYFGNAIPAGGSGTFRAHISGITGVLYTDNEDDSYASAVFIPNYFGSDFTQGSSDITVVYHLPPGVQPDEPKWHTADHSGFPDTPGTGTDSQGRITYTWRNANASPSTDYLFGASFPKSYVPAGTISEPNFWQRLGIDPEAFLPFLMCCCFGGIFGGIIWISVVADRKRRMQYLPPKISIEGHGIKRGLTAPEAAILLEQPMDKIMTMILFSVIKKGAAQVAKKDPLELTVTEPLPKGLHEYETAFVQSFQETTTSRRRRGLQDMMVALVKAVANKMRGFSKRETVAYYKKITEDAWKQVESADTPMVKSKSYQDNLEWTMMDRDYERRTSTIFPGPMYAPYWWHSYDPTYRGSTLSSSGRTVISAPSRSTGGGVSLPNLPGSDFAASMVNGVQNFAGGVMGGVASFTGGVTKVTNPPPPPTRSSGGRGGGFSGGGSSCACACAGCACACAGGGR